jgi:hypothetical protein
MTYCQSCFPASELGKVTEYDVVVLEDHSFEYDDVVVCPMDVATEADAKLNFADTVDVTDLLHSLVLDSECFFAVPCCREYLTLL